MHAQARPTFSFDVIPENYEAGQRVTLSLRSFSVELDNQNIVWTIDNKIVLQGKGKKTFTTTAPTNDVEKKVLVRVDTALPIEKIFVLKTKNIDLYVESVDGYIPVWYRGRSRIVEESIVKIIAVPDSISAIQSDTNTVYTWSKNGFTDKSQSGTGKQAYMNKLSPFNSNESISVSISKFVKSVVITPQSTELELYEYSPLIGTRFNTIISTNFKLVKDDVTLEVIPWFFSLTDLNNSFISTTWTLNGLPVSNQSLKSFLNIRKDGTNTGSANLKISVQHKDRTLQTNRKVVKIDLR